MKTPLPQNNDNPPPFMKGRKTTSKPADKMKEAKQDAAKRRLAMMNQKPKGK